MQHRSQAEATCPSFACDSGLRPTCLSLEAPRLLRAQTSTGKTVDGSGYGLPALRSGEPTQTFPGPQVPSAAHRAWVEPGLGLGHSGANGLFLRLPGSPRETAEAVPGWGPWLARRLGGACTGKLARPAQIRGLPGGETSGRWAPRRLSTGAGTSRQGPWGAGPDREAVTMLGSWMGALRLGVGWQSLATRSICTPISPHYLQTPMIPNYSVPGTPAEPVGETSMLPGPCPPHLRTFSKK